MLDSTDLLRQLWRSRQYQAFNQALSAGSIPSASMLRQALAPRSLGPDIQSLNLKNEIEFFHALVGIACSLEQSLKNSPSMAGQMAENKSFHLLAAALCQIAPSPELEADPRLVEAFISIFAKSPKSASDGIASSQYATNGKSPFFLQTSINPLWTLAARLPPKAAQTLISHALTANGPLDPKVAWDAFLNALRYKRLSPSLLVLLRHARAPNAKSFQSACAAVAFLEFSQSHRYPLISSNQEARALTEYLCASHADMEGALCAQALLGSHEKNKVVDPYDSFRIASHSQSKIYNQGISVESNTIAMRGLRFLDWIEHCTTLAARYHMPDIGSQSLSNKSLEQTYATLNVNIVLAHSFPLGFPSLGEAFDSRKGAHILNTHSQQAPPLARTRKSL